MNHELEGKTYPPVRFRLEETRVRAFAYAVGHRGPGVPPTIVTVPEIEAGLSNVVSDPELGVDLARVLHGEQEYVWARPAALEEVLRAESAMGCSRGEGGRRFLSLRTELRDETGRVVVSGRSTLIVRGDE